MADDRLFDRIAILRVGKPGELGREFSSVIIPDDPKKQPTRGFRISFDIEKTDIAIPNKATVVIYNLNTDNRNFCRQTGVNVELLAGYGQKPKLLYSGQFTRAISHDSGPDVLTTFEMGDGIQAFQNSTTDASFAPGTNVKDILNTLAKSFGLPLGEVSGVPNMVVQNGATFSGPTRDHMNDMTSRLGLEWSIQNGAVQILAAGAPTTQDVILLSKETGLIGSPHPKEKGLEVVSLLQPDISPGRLVQVVSKAFPQGQNFRASKVVHKGDTDEQEWYTKIEVLNS